MSATDSELTAHSIMANRRGHRHAGCLASTGCHDAATAQRALCNRARCNIAAARGRYTAALQATTTAA